MADMYAKLLDDRGRHNTITVVLEGSRVRLREEIKRRRISEEEFAKRAGISYTWLRHILAGAHAGDEARAKIREALSHCTVCPCRLDVPADEVLFSVATRKGRR